MKRMNMKYKLPCVYLRINNNIDSCGTAQLVKRRASNRKVAKTWFDFRCGSASLGPSSNASWGQAVYSSTRRGGPA